MALLSGRGLSDQGPSLTKSLKVEQLRAVGRGLLAEEPRRAKPPTASASSDGVAAARARERAEAAAAAVANGGDLPDRHCWWCGTDGTRGDGSIGWNSHNGRRFCRHCALSFGRAPADARPSTVCGGCDGCAMAVPKNKTKKKKRSFTPTKQKARIDAKKRI